MPTAVERLFDSFLKFAGIREQAALNDAFLKIDDDLLKLSNASADSFLKIEHERSLKIDVSVIGDAFLKLGNDFHKIDLGLRLLDDFVVKVAGVPTPGSVDGAPSLQADFVALDHKISTSATDLKLLGADFLKLDTSPTVEVFQAKIAGLGNDFLKLGADMAADRDAFLKLGADFLKLAGGDKVSPLELDYKELGGELQTVGMQFDALATDFLKLDQALHGGGGGAGRVESATGGAGAGVVGAALMTLYQDFHTLGADLAVLGDGSVTVVRDLSHQSFLAPGGHSDHGGHG